MCRTWVLKCPFYLFLFFLVTPHTRRKARCAADTRRRASQDFLGLFRARSALLSVACLLLTRTLSRSAPGRALASDRAGDLSSSAPRLGLARTKRVTKRVISSVRVILEMTLRVATRRTAPWFNFSSNDFFFQQLKLNMQNGFSDKVEDLGFFPFFSARR